MHMYARTCTHAVVFQQYPISVFDCAGPLPADHPGALGAVPGGGFLGPGCEPRPLRVPSQGGWVAQCS